MSLNQQRPVPLPRGRHKLSRDDVLGSQRARLLAAMIDEVARRGYGETTVGDVVSAARVSRNAFYELFADKEDCFLAASDAMGKETLAALYAQADRPSWREALREGLAIYLRRWQERPRFARAYLVELPTAGPRAQQQRDRVYDDFGRMFEALAARARAEEAELPPLSTLAARFLVTGITELVAAEIRAGRGERLDEIEAELYDLIVRAIAG